MNTKIQEILTELKDVLKSEELCVSCDTVTKCDFKPVMTLWYSDLENDIDDFIEESICSSPLEQAVAIVVIRLIDHFIEHSKLYTPNFYDDIYFVLDDTCMLRLQCTRVQTGKSLVVNMHTIAVYTVIDFVADWSGWNWITSYFW